MRWLLGVGEVGKEVNAGRERKSKYVKDKRQGKGVRKDKDRKRAKTPMCSGKE